MTVEPPADAVWAAWSRESVRWLQERGRDLKERRGLGDGTTYQWDLDRCLITFETPTAGRVELEIVCVGTTAADGTFLWGWANETHPERSRAAMREVQDFGVRHDLGLLIDPMWEGGHGEALEMLAIAGRVLDADGFWVEPESGVYFLLFEPSA